MRYASNTQVSADRSISEIKKTVTRYGAENFIFAETPLKGIVGFTMAGRSIRISIKLPPIEDYVTTPQGRARHPAVAAELREKGTRQMWRCLALVVKAKLEAVDSGISSVDDEFLAFIMVDGHTTVGDALKTRMSERFFGKNAPQLLPMLEEHKEEVIDG
jgi:hypothetical protein